MRSLLAGLAAVVLSHGGLPCIVRAVQQSAPAALDPVGVWRGTSLCTVRPSPCNDESVVYRISRVNSSDSLSIDGRRVVSGQEVEMGVLGCKHSTANATVTCTMPNGTWRFTLRGDSLVGDLKRPDGTKFRDVRTVRSR